jgi:hypothetical protein
MKSKKSRQLAHRQEMNSVVDCRRSCLSDKMDVTSWQCGVLVVVHMLSLISKKYCAWHTKKYGAQVVEMRER